MSTVYAQGNHSSVTAAALDLCRQLFREYGFSEVEMEIDPKFATGRPDDLVPDWYVYQNEIRGQVRRLRTIAGAAALGDVQCLVRLRGLFGLPIFS